MEESKGRFIEEGEVVPEALLKEDLGADSLGMLELTFALEEEFHIDISDEKVDEVKTVQDVIDLVS